MSQRLGIRVLATNMHISFLSWLVFVVSNMIFKYESGGDLFKAYRAQQPPEPKSTLSSALSHASHSIIKPLEPRGATEYTSPLKVQGPPLLEKEKANDDGYGRLNSEGLQIVSKGEIEPWKLVLPFLRAFVAVMT